MKLIQQHIRKQKSFKMLVMLLLALLMGACSADMDNFGLEEEANMLPISFSLPVRSSSSEGEVVSEIRLLAFDKTGACIKNTLIAFNGSTTLPASSANRTSDPILMIPGTFDFVFIANETSSLLPTAFKNALPNVSNKAQLNVPAFNNISFTSFTNSIVEAEMPMSAYYKDIYLPNSAYSYDDPFKFPLTLDLVRALSKIEINLNNKFADAPSVKRVTKLKISNVGSRFSLPALSEFYTQFYDPATVTNIEVPIPFTEADYKNEKIGQLVVYIPEFLKDKNIANPEKVVLRFEGNGFIPYEFVLREDASYSDFNQPRPLDFNTLSNYSVVRNTHYKLNLYLTINRVLEGVLEVMPWEKKDSEINFSKPEFNLANFSIKVGGVEMKSNQEISLKTGQEALITFKLDNPTGGIWRASVTNGLNFDFVDPTLARGMAGTSYDFKIKATKPWSGTPTFTEFYIAVAGVELPLWKNSTGLNNRYIFKQIE